MNYRNIKKIVRTTLSEYNNMYSTNLKVDDIKYIDPNDHDEAYVSEKEVYYNHKNILYVKESLFDKDEYTLKAILFHEFTHIEDIELFINYPEIQFVELMKIYSEVHASENEMDLILTFQNKPYDLEKDIMFIGQIPLHKLLEFSLNNVKAMFTLPDEKLTEKNAPFDYCELYYYIGKIRSINKNGLSYPVNYQKEFESVNKPFSNLLIEIINYCVNSDMTDYDKLIQLQEKLTDTIIEFGKEHNAKYQ